MKIPTFLQRLLSHPLCVLSIALPITAAINLVRYLLGYEQSILFGAFTGFAAVLLTQFFLSRKTSGNMSDAIKGLVTHLRGLDPIILYTVFAACLWMFTVAPSEKYVKDLGSAVNSLAFGIYMLYTIGWAINTVFFLSPNPLFNLIHAAARGLFAWCGVQWCLGELGDDLYRFAVADPQTAGLWFIACVVASFIGSFGIAARRKVSFAAVRGEGHFSGAKSAVPRVQAASASAESTNPPN